LGQSWVEEIASKGTLGGRTETQTMKKTRHTEETIIQVLNEARAGGAVAEICRRHGISEPTYYKWKQKYGGMQVNEARRLRLVEEENRKLKKLVADQALDMMVLKELLSKKS
jgi:putative transposase